MQTQPIDLICLKTGQLARSGELPQNGTDHEWMPLHAAEPYFTQAVGSDVEPGERTTDGRFDKSHLSPERAYRIGRDFLAHAIRYGYPMKVIREHFGAGARILEMGCGKELPLFRTLTMDHGAVKYYKPSVYVGADLNPVKYKPKVTGIEVVILERTNIVDDHSKVPDIAFDIVVSTEVIEHMDKPDGERFLDAMFAFARRKRDREDRSGMILLSTPVNGGTIAKNHVYEWFRGEMRRAFEKRGGTVLTESGTFANLSDIVPVLSAEEKIVWNSLSSYLSPHVLSCMFSPVHPEAARNICWLVQV